MPLPICMNFLPDQMLNYVFVKNYIKASLPLPVSNTGNIAGCSIRVESQELWYEFIFIAQRFLLYMLSLQVKVALLYAKFLVHWVLCGLFFCYL